MYDYDDFSKARSFLRGKTFSGMKGYDAFHYLEQPLFDYMRGSSKAPNAKGMLFPFIANNFEFDFGDGLEGKNLFYYSSIYAARRDCKIFLDNIISVIDSPAALVGSLKPRIRPLNILNFFRALSWRRALREMKLDKSGKRFLIYRLAFCVNFKRYIERNAFRLKGARVFITLNDENCDENVFVQFCKKQGIPTVDLEHGHYDVTERGRSLDRVTNTLENFTSDRYFAWGEYAKRVAAESGVPEEKIVAVGNPKFIGVTDFPSPSNDDVFGVILDGGGLYSLESNKAMLRIADAIASKYGYKYVIKHHPVYDMKLLENAYDEKNVAFICERFMSVRDYASNVRFSIASASSVYAELLFLRQIVFRYVHPGKTDNYRFLGGGGFSDECGAFELVDRDNNEPDQFKEVFAGYAEMLCGKGDIGDNYRRAINELAGKGDLE